MWEMISVLVLGASESCQSGVPAGTCTVHALSPPAHNATKVPWLSDLLKQAPLQSQGSTPRPTGGNHTPFSSETQIKKHWWHHCLPSLQNQKNQKGSQRFSLISMCSGRHNKVLLLPTMQVETTKPPAAVELNNRAKMVEASQLEAIYSLRDVQEPTSRSVESLPGSQIEVSWCWVESIRARRCSAENVHSSWMKPEQVCENLREQQVTFIRAENHWRMTECPVSRPAGTSNKHSLMSQY